MVALSVRKMASMVRLLRLGHAAIRNRNGSQCFYLPACSISTSKKNKDTISVAEPIITPAEKTRADEYAAKVKKNWVSYGFDYKDEGVDRAAFNACFFFSVTLCMVLGGFVFMYQPDFRLRDWSIREAYLELHRREKNGLPLIDMNLLPPDTIELPSDEELGETEIII